MSIAREPTRLESAKEALFEPNGLDEQVVAGFLDELSGRDSDFAELYFETTTQEDWSLRNGRVTQGAFSIAQGVGARAAAGERTSFAFASEMTPTALRSVIGANRDMRRQGHDAAKKGGAAVFRPGAPERPAYDAISAADSLAAADKIELLRRIDDLARRLDPRIEQVNAQLQIKDSTIIAASSDRAMAGDVRPLVQVTLTVLAAQGGRTASGVGGFSRRVALAEVTLERVEALARRAVDMAIAMLEALPAPAGEMTVVLGPGFPGVMLHEAVGHGLEGDAHRKRSSVFAGQIGQRIAAAGVTVLDDATLADARGSLNIDDEGAPGERTVLIEDGRLVGLMQDRLNARLMNGVTTGNARRQSYAHLPMPRMTNTFLAAGPHDPGEIIASVERGIYAPSFGGGTVDITSGQFNFSAIEAYLIENGKVTAPVTGATLIGLGHEALQQVSMVGNDLEIDIGVCSKAGQVVPVCVGQPTVRIDKMVVGGSAV